jgi:hypothetical protein
LRFWRTASGGAIGPRTSAVIGDDIDVLDIEKGAGQLGGLFQQAHVHDLIGHGLRDDHFVLRVDGDLRVIADANLRMGGHRLGAYPNMFFVVPEPEIGAFSSAVARIKSAAEYERLVDSFGVRRSNEKFWPVYDEINATYLASDPVRSGILDLTRYALEDK